MLAVLITGARPTIALSGTVAATAAAAGVGPTHVTIFAGDAVTTAIAVAEQSHSGSGGTLGYHIGRHTAGDAVRREVLGDHGSGAHHSAVPDSDPASTTTLAPSHTSSPITMSRSFFGRSMIG